MRVRATHFGPMLSLVSLIMLVSCSQSPTADHQSAPTGNTTDLTANVDNQQYALNLVMGQPDVKRWLLSLSQRNKLHPTSLTLPVIKTDSQNAGSIVVRVYAKLPNGDITNFGYFRVDTSTHTVQKI